MDQLQGQFFVVWIVATVAACALAWWLGRRYRRALVALMRAPLAPNAAKADPLATAVGLAQATAELPAWLPPALPTRSGWARAEWRLLAGLVALSVLMALTRGAITHWQALGNLDSGTRTLSLALIFAWPVLVALARMRRWSAPGLALALALWFVAALGFATWRTTEAQTLQGTLMFLAFEMGAPAAAMVAMSTRRLRAAAPWLWLPLALLVLAALLGLDLLVWLFDRGSPLIAWLVPRVDPVWVMVAFPLAALALAWWPVMRFARALARAYSARRVSDLMVHFSAAWVLNLSFDATAAGALVLLPLLWIPFALALAHAWQRRQHASRRPPTLLVLRVFQQDANVTALFNDVVERWRCVGPTVLIAGTDLVDQTLDAGDLFDFLDGRLATRFVRQASDVPVRLAAFDWGPDAEGRWRVNECYCHDQAWQLALLALLQRADLVLMDLRGFQARNAGCRFELGALARAAHVQRVVVLTDPATDLATAQADAAAAPPGRFAWIALPADRRLARRRAARQVREALAPTSSASDNAIRPAISPL